MRNAASSSPFAYAALGLGAILLSACASSPSTRDEGFEAAASPKKRGAEQLSADVRDYGRGSRKYKDSVGVFTNPQADPSGLDPIAAAAYWGTRYDKDNRDAEAAVQYSAALRKIGSVSEAVEVMTKASERNPDQPEVALETGRALIEADRAFEAVRHVEKALEARRRDWRALSVYGVALDQIGEHELAREKYDAALAIAPDAVSVMSNKGLSYAMSGDLSDAVATLRVAATHRKADARVRQNYALALAMKGDLREAERLARSDLPPQIADNNVQFYRQIVNQPAYWQNLARQDIDAPDFDAPATAAPTPLSRPQPKPAKAAPAPRLDQPAPAPKVEEKKTSPVALSGAASAVKAALEVPAPQVPAPTFTVEPDAPAAAKPKQ